MQLEVGIPILRDSKKGLNKAIELRALGFSGPIHVSVNESDFVSGGVDGDSLIRVTHQVSNLGLYGNFKFLIDSCESEWFAWLAIDDSIPIELFNYVRTNNNIEADLIVGPIVTFDASTRTTLDISNPLESKNSFGLNPSMIFGVWRKEWLQGIFPNQVFDWLDTYLLTKTLASGTINYVEKVQLRISHSSKQPHTVNGKYHSPWLWTKYAYKLVKDMRDFMCFSKAVFGRFTYSLKSLKSFFVRTLF